MKCKYPVKLSATSARKCGQCLHCRINERRTWAHRVVLEALNHHQSSFLTLTYSDEHLPQDEYFHPKTGEIFAPLSVRPDHHRKFMNDLRGHFFEKFNSRLRFYGCAEYGEDKERPHYHYALFGFPHCLGPGAVTVGRKFYPCRCRNCAFVSEIWGKGNIFLGTLSLDSAQYIAGYVTKKLTSNSNYRQDGYLGLTNAQKLRGRYPEFSRMSTRPGLAAYAADNIVNRLTFYDKTSHDDVPRILLHGAKQLPIGRYLNEKINAQLFPGEDPQDKARRFEWSMFRMLLHHAKNPEIVSRYQQSGLASSLAFLNFQSSLELSKKTQLFSRGKNL